MFLHRDDAVLMTTVEPCAMCLGAVVMADVPHIVFAAADRNAGVPAVLEAESRALCAYYRPDIQL